MSQTCKVCDLGKDIREKIDRELVSGRSKSSLSREYNVPKDSLRYHLQNHLVYQLVSGAKRRAENHGVDVMDSLYKLTKRTEAILDRAEKQKHSGVMLAAIRELRNNYQLVAQIQLKMQEQQIPHQHTVVNNESWEEGLQVNLLPEEKNIHFEILMKAQEGHGKLIEGIIYKDNPDIPTLNWEEDDNKDKEFDTTRHVAIKAIRGISKDGPYLDSPSKVDPIYSPEEIVDISPVTEPQTTDVESSVGNKMQRTRFAAKKGESVGNSASVPQGNTHKDDEGLKEPTGVGPIIPNEIPAHSKNMTPKERRQAYGGINPTI